MNVFTIGVYNATEEEFFNKLINNGIDYFCDIRQRRGVRGSQYAFVNSARLQDRLRRLGINYMHIKELAPTKEIRDKQRTEDKRLGEHKRDRNQLGEVFVSEYKKLMMRFDFDAFSHQLASNGAKNVAFFCVEEKPAACHRSIVAEEMNKRYGYKVTNL